MLLCACLSGSAAAVPSCCSNILLYCVVTSMTVVEASAVRGVVFRVNPAT